MPNGVVDPITATVCTGRTLLAGIVKATVSPVVLLVAAPMDFVARSLRGVSNNVNRMADHTIACRRR